MIRGRDRSENRVYVVEELRPLNHDVLPALLGELNNSAIGIFDRPRQGGLRHAAAAIAPVSARVKRSASSPAGRAWR
jgi:hypothetical protein